MLLLTTDLSHVLLLEDGWIREMNHRRRIQCSCNHLGEEGLPLDVNIYEQMLFHHIQVQTQGGDIEEEKTIYLKYKCWALAEYDWLNRCSLVFYMKSCHTQMHYIMIAASVRREA